ncbi:MAG: hypothetical protein HFJ64_03920 [Eggerthellaceae bacterium]|nr:hypothetical protein [Eggerthellaceae bacterium]
MSSRADDVKQEAQEALKSKKKIETYMQTLSDGSRRERQQAASVIAAMTKENPAKMSEFIGGILDALDCPEAQTRWEALDALTELVAVDSRNCEKAIVGAENALFDEDSGPLRLAAMRFLCKLGATTEARSEKVWGLIDEGIQCYHGDLEFQDMLVAVIDFSTGKLAPSVAEELAARMKFDAENGKGTLKKRATQIEENLAKKAK